MAESLPRGKRPGARERLPAQPLLQGRAGDLPGQARTRIGQAVLRPGARGETDASSVVAKLPSGGRAPQGARIFICRVLVEKTVFRLRLPQMPSISRSPLIKEYSNSLTV